MDRDSSDAGLSVYLCAADPGVTSRRARCARDARLPYRELSPAQAPELPPDAVACVCSRVVAAVRPPCATVTVSCGVSLCDEALLAVASPNVVTMRCADLTPETLLEAIVRARFAVDTAPVAQAFPAIPPEIVRAFLAAPRRFRVRDDCRSALHLSRQQLRDVTRRAEVERFEFLRTQLRAHAWEWLARAGVKQAAVMRYLGIDDRSNFRRACRSARISPPWKVVPARGSPRRHPPPKGGPGGRARAASGPY